MQDNLKIMYRVKFESAYAAARELIKQGMAYGAYLCLKEAARAICCYVISDVTDQQFGQKIKLHKVLDMTQDIVGREVEDIQELSYLLELEQGGVPAQANADCERLNRVRKAIKRISGLYMSCDL